MTVLVGETVTTDFGDRVVERCVVSVTETNVRSMSRKLSGEPYAPPDREVLPWDCTKKEWRNWVEAMKKVRGSKHELPNV